MSNKFSALRHLVGIICTTSLYCENTLLSLKVKAQISQQYYHLYNKNKVLGEFHQQVKIK